MDGLMILAVLFVLFLLAGGLLSFSNFSTIRQLRREIATLKNLVNLQSGQINRLNKQVGSGDEKSDTTETSQPQENAPVTKRANACFRPGICSCFRVFAIFTVGKINREQ